MKDVNGIRSSHAQRYGAVPSIFVAPGRVNIIGEHVDYNGFAVLPMALVRDTLIAARFSTRLLPTDAAGVAAATGGGAADDDDDD